MRPLFGPRRVNSRGFHLGLEYSKSCSSNISLLISLAVQALMANPDLNVAGKQISAFDLTEEMDSADAVQALRAGESP